MGNPINNKAFQALAAEMTAKTVKPAFVVVPTCLKDLASNDPIQEDIDLDVNPDINPKDVLRIRTNRIVDKYETEEERQLHQAEENDDCGMPDEHNFWIGQLVEQQEEALRVSIVKPVILTRPDYYTGNSFTSSDGKTRYTEVRDAEGVVYIDDSSGMCTKAEAGTAASISAKHIESLAAKGAAMNDDLMDDTQKANLTVNVDAKGNITEKTPAEKAIALATTRMDNEATKLPYQLDMTDRIIADVSRQSAADAAIKTTVAPTEQFSAAATATPETKPKSVVFKETAPLPWATKPVEPSNTPKFELSA